MLYRTNLATSVTYYLPSMVLLVVRSRDRKRSRDEQSVGLDECSSEAHEPCKRRLVVVRHSAAGGAPPHDQVQVQSSAAGPQPETEAGPVKPKEMDELVKALSKSHLQDGSDLASDE
jgi:hypothetical protein